MQTENTNTRDSKNSYLPKRSNGSLAAFHEKEGGRGAELFKTLKSQHPNDLAMQVHEFFKVFPIYRSRGRKMLVRPETTKDYVDRVNSFLKRCADIGIGLANIDDLTLEHIQLCFMDFEADGVSPAAIANIHTAIRRLTNWLGMSGICPPLTTLVIDPSNARRQPPNCAITNWKQLSIDVELAIARLESVCLVSALQLGLAKAFGTDIKLFLNFCPAQSVDGDVLYLKGTSKGSGVRSIPIETAQQKSLIARAFELSDGHPNSILATKKVLSQ